MVQGDGLENARTGAARFEHLPVSHSWDGDRELGKLYATTLGLNRTAWDVYLLYQPGITWDDETPPSPTFWMHQLGSNFGADPALALNPQRLAEELAKLLNKSFSLDLSVSDSVGERLRQYGLETVPKGVELCTVDIVIRD